MNLPFAEALFIIALAMLMNIWQTSRLMAGKASDKQSFVALVFDVCQLSALLFLTGGLLNPFAVLLLGPVVVSAAILRRRQTFTLIAITTVAVTVVAFFNFPLPWVSVTLQSDDSYLVGLWMAMVFSVTFIGAHVWWVASRARGLGDALAEARVVLAKEQEAVALGTLATSAAHKLGSPLNTIALIGHDLSNELAKEHPMYEDMKLLRDEVDRCRVILGELDDYQSAESLGLYAPIPLDALVRDIIENRLGDREGEVVIEFNENSALPMPFASRRPELMHALENLLGNALDFATSRVTLEIQCTMHEVYVTIVDDGPGFASAVLGYVGTPWNSSRGSKDGHRGLGIFLASTLIETLGGSITYANGEHGGALVGMCVPRDALLVA